MGVTSLVAGSQEQSLNSQALIQARLGFGIQEIIKGTPNVAAAQEVNLDALKTRLDALFQVFMHLKMAIPESMDAEKSQQA
jgi:hypothetical protein